MQNRISTCSSSLGFVLAVVLSVMPSGAAAQSTSAVTVTDSSIELPGDGWYQVQDAMSLASICEGVSICNVPAGTYIVINHTTGERFENITVSGTSGGMGSVTPTNSTGGQGNISIAGDTLSWPDNGWYQVQSASDFSTLCEGGRSCQVPAGSYIVINHSTGERYENITVNVASSGAGNSGGDNNNNATASTEALDAELNLRIAVYSTTAAELFWDASAQSDRRYQISRNGVVLDETGGTSFFDNTLQPGLDYTYSVLTIDPFGTIYRPAQVNFSTAGVSTSSATDSGTSPGNSTSVITQESPTGSPTAATPISTDLSPMFPETSNTPSPQNITLAVYSESTAELNWTRPFFGDGIELNEIWRNGELIDTIPGGGNSYVDGARTPGQQYRYEIVAINRFGRASSVFIDVGVSGGPVGTGTPVDESELPGNLVSALDNTFHLFNATAFEKLAATVFRLDDPVARGLQLVGSEPARFLEGVDRLEYACPQGGRWIVTDLSSVDDGKDIEAVECSIGPITLSGRGQYRNLLALDGITLRRNLIFSLVSLSDSRDNSLITMSFSNSFYDLDGSSGLASGDNISVMRPQGNYQAESFFLSATPAIPSAIELNGENVNGGLASVARIRTREILLKGDNGFPSSGSVSIIQTGSNRENYDISAGNGNPDTFTFTATVDGATTVYELNWSDNRNIGINNLSTVDVGF